MKIGELFNLKKGKKPGALYETKSSGLVRFIQIEDLRNDRNLKFCEQHKSNVLCSEDDIVIAWDGANAGTVGWGLSGAVGSTLAVLSLKKKNDCYAPFVGRFLSFKQDFLREKRTGATIPHLQKDSLINLEVPKKSYDDQIHINEKLELIDSLLNKRRLSIAKLNQLAQSIFLDMFGDPQENPKNFPVKPLKKFYIDDKNGTKCGPFGSALKKGEYQDNGIAVWNMDNITSTGKLIDIPRLWITPAKFSELESYSVIDGDVIISRAGTVGKMCVVRSTHKQSIISTNLIRVRFGESLIPEYFVSLMIFCKGRVGRLKTGSDGAFTHMNTGILDDLSFPYPPIELQKDFIKRLSKITELKIKLDKSIMQLTGLQQSLSQKFFGN